MSIILEKEKLQLTRSPMLRKRLCHVYEEKQFLTPILSLNMSTLDSYLPRILQIHIVYFIHLPVHEVSGHPSDSASIPIHLFPSSQSRYLSLAPSRQYFLSVQVDQGDHTIHCPKLDIAAVLDLSIKFLDNKPQARRTRDIK